MTCGEGGILGPVVGIMGVLQALEAIKIIAGGAIETQAAENGVKTARSDPESVQTPQWLLFSAYSSTPFRSLRMRRRQKNCAACSSHATATRESLLSGSMDYVQFCGAVSPINVLSPNERVSAEEYAAIEKSQDARSNGSSAPLILVDTRDKVQFDLCNLKDSVNIPYSEIAAADATNMQEAAANQEQNDEPREDEWLHRVRATPPDVPVYVVCRLGNDSQLAVQKFKELGLDAGGKRQIRDIRGGLKAWRDKVDPGFPNY